MLQLTLHCLFVFLLNKRDMALCDVFQFPQLKKNDIGRCFPNFDEHQKRRNILMKKCRFFENEISSNITFNLNCNTKQAFV